MIWGLHWLDCLDSWNNWLRKRNLQKLNKAM